VDGANLNALVGLARPGRFGADVSHLNLHKTFCIPHGGGGPGVGPVCVVADLVPYLPGHASGGVDGAVGAVSAAPLGNAGVLPISWMYIRMTGEAGLRAATEKVERGEWPRDDNPLKSAPHTAASLLVADWRHAYTREDAAYPEATLRHDKYWSPVGRVDNVWGDRNLSCSCPPLSSYED